MAKEGNIRIRFDVEPMIRALNQFSEAVRAMHREVFITAAKKLLRDLRTTLPPFYRRWYFKAAYAAVDAFPEWVSVW